MTKQPTRLRGRSTLVMCTALAILRLSPALAETSTQVCPSRELVDAFTGGKEAIPFQYASGYESVTFITKQGQPRVPEPNEVSGVVQVSCRRQVGHRSPGCLDARVWDSSDPPCTGSDLG